MTRPNKKVLVLALSGIGNLLMQFPLISTLKQRHPEYSITVWVAPRGTKALAKSHPAIDHVIEAPIKRSIFLQSRFVHKLACQRFDIGLMLSPGQLWKGAVHLLLAGIPRRLAHQYPHLGHLNSSFLLTNSIPEQNNLHDIEQNLNLLTLIDPNFIPAIISYKLPIPPVHQSAADAMFAKLRIDHKPVIGLHAGSGPDLAFKRWLPDNFAKVGQYLIQNHNAHILIFGGPDEKQQKKQLRRALGRDHSSIINTNLLTTAGLMTHLHLMLSNDSGLMHLAAAAGARTIGLFGPTDEKITGPRGLDSEVIRAPNTKPVFNTESNFDLGRKPHSTMLAITPSQVIDSLQSFLLD